MFWEPLSLCVSVVSVVVDLPPLGDLWRCFAGLDFHSFQVSAGLNPTV